MVATNQLKKYQKQIIAEEKRILKLESKIEKGEKTILRSQKKLFSMFGTTKMLTDGVSKWEAKFLQDSLVKKVVKHKTLYVLLTGFAVILIWKGIWDMADQTFGFDYPWLPVAVGFGLLLLLKRVDDLV